MCRYRLICGDGVSVRGYDNARPSLWTRRPTEQQPPTKRSSQRSTHRSDRSATALAVSRCTGGLHRCPPQGHAHPRDTPTQGHAHPSSVNEQTEILHLLFLRGIVLFGRSSTSPGSETTGGSILSMLSCCRLATTKRCWKSDGDPCFSFRSLFRHSYGDKCLPLLWHQQFSSVLV